MARTWHSSQCRYNRGQCVNPVPRSDPRPTCAGSKTTHCIPFSIPLVGLRAHMHRWELLREHIRNMSKGEQLTLGLIWCYGTNGRIGRQLSKRAQGKTNLRLIDAALTLASCQAGLTGITTVGMGHGIQQWEPLQGFTHSEMCVWHDQQSDPNGPLALFEAEKDDVHRKAPMKIVTEQLRDDLGQRVIWQSVCWIQLLGHEPNGCDRSCDVAPRHPYAGRSWSSTPD